MKAIQVVSNIVFANEKDREHYIKEHDPSLSFDEKSELLSKSELELEVETYEDNGPTHTAKTTFKLVDLPDQKEK